MEVLNSFAVRLGESARRVEETLEAFFGLHGDPESRLIEAMRHGTLGGGKRVRPFLVLSSSRICGVDERCALRVACAVEMVHCYSLIHDDLPAMDDDDMRRGRPTVHKAFDEATAILAGDALLTKAFEVLADPASHADPVVRADLVLTMSKAIGAEGMVGGQMLDLLAESRDLTMAEVTRLQRMKTGELIAFSCEAGAILGKVSNAARHALRAYAHDLGLAFQIADDLLDVEGDVAVVGKATAKDAGRGKATFVSLMGVERARAQARILADQAIQHLDIFPESADPLRELAHYVVDRKS